MPTKVVKIGKRGLIKTPDSFTAVAMQNGNSDVDVYFGSNYDVIVVVQHNKALSKDNQERIRILTEVKQ